MIQSYTLAEKYNKAIPRYTSYPSVPHWQKDIPSEEEWFMHVNGSLEKDPHLSLYIHLPYCENLCTYCGCNKRITKNHCVEEPYIRTILQEWKLYLSRIQVKPILKELHLGGGTPTFFSPNHLHTLIEGITSTVHLPDEHYFSFEAHPDSTTEEHLVVLRKLGFNRISIGVQDVSPAILKAINRKQTADQVTFVTEMARKHGYSSINYDIIYGLPFQEHSNISDTIDLIEKQRPERIAFYSYAHVPWKSKGQRAFTDEDVPRGEFKFSLREFGFDRLRKLGYCDIGMDHFALPEDTLYQAYKSGTMHRNFMGYTERFVGCQIGLGASSISDSWDMYVQNNVKVEDYRDGIEKGHLPIVKGHILSSEEVKIRHHMLNLICRNETSWDPHAKRGLVHSENLRQMTEMKQDGIIDFDDHSIQVSTIGPAFIRNICAAIDPNLTRTSTAEKAFSQSI